MATRTIVTSHPDVACDVCERRLLRGEQPDIFLAAGRRRTVCELCAPRAAHEGWMRERDSQAVTLPPMRPRRGRSFFDRLRQAGRPPGAEDEQARAEEAGEHESDAYDFLEGYRRAETAPVPAVPQAPVDFLSDEPAHANGLAPVPAAAAQRPLTYAERAVDVFNASEYPRRVAGVARSLGTPVVNVRSAEHLASVVTIVIAWELCWYRYEVDLSEPSAEAQATAQGTELSELDREERVGNALASDAGVLSLLGD
jgi:hypothetical protein